MTNKEYHIHNKITDELEQAFVFKIIRDEKHHTLQLSEIYIVTIAKGVETKTLLDLTEIMPLIAQTPGGNVPKENLIKMGEVLKHVLTEETKIDLITNELDCFVERKETERMLAASNAALSAHPTVQSIEDIVNAKIKNNKC